MRICPASIAELVAVSRYAGGDVLLAQGGGGNTSVKSDDGRCLWIKTSGVKLAEMSETSGYLSVDLTALRRLLDDPSLTRLPPRQAHEESVRLIQEAVEGGTNLRPSLETSFHAALPQRVVLHTHPVYVNAFACMMGGQAAAGAAFTWVEYATPGFALGLLVAQATRAVGEPTGILLENHGLICSGADAASAVAVHERAVALGRSFFGDLPSDATRIAIPSPAAREWAARLQAALGGERVVRPAALGALLAPCEEPPTGGALVPDDVVYGIHDVRVADRASVPARWLAEQAPLPSQAIVWLRGHGFVLVGASERNVAFMEESLLANVAIHELIARRGQPRYLPAEEIAQLSCLESEKYRQAVAAGRVRA